MGAWRPYSNLIAGELDNTRPGRVTGWLSFSGMKDVVELDLEGDFHRDIRGTVVRLHNPAPPVAVPEYMQGFNATQTGKVGDMTAGLEPQDYTDYPYFEWYSENGRVVLELEPHQVQVIGTPKPWQEEKPISRAEQEQNLGRFMAEMAQSISATAVRDTSEQSEAAEQSSSTVTTSLSETAMTGAGPEHVANKTYVVQIEETVDFWQKVSVEAPNVDTAKELALQEYQADWENSSQVSIEAIPLKGHEEEVPIQLRVSERHFERLSRAEAALSGYRDVDHVANVTDLFTDLLHWSNTVGIDFERALHRARGHYQTESQEQAEDQSRANQQNAAQASRASTFSTSSTPTAESSITGSSKVKEICHVESGPFTAILQGQYNPRSETWTYRAAILQGDKELLEPMLKHEIAGVHQLAQKRGGHWLAETRLSRGVTPLHAENQELLDFEGALKASESLISRFAERGHHAALQDQSITDELELRPEAEQSPSQHSRTIIRGR